MIKVDVTGIKKSIDMMNRLPQHKRAVGEVYIEGPRNQNLAEYHTSPEPRSKMPLRNVFFVPPAKLRSVGRIIVEGVREVLRGRSSGMMQAMGDAAKMIAKTFQWNIDRGKTSTGKIAPLSPDYREWKEATYGKQPILVATGEFYRAIKSRVTRDR